MSIPHRSSGDLFHWLGRISLAGDNVGDIGNEAFSTWPTKQPATQKWLARTWPSALLSKMADSCLIGEMFEDDPQLL